MFMKVERYLVRFASVIIFLSLFSCSKDDRENTMIQQETSIEAYALTYDEDKVVAYDKVWRIVLNEGAGSLEAQRGDSVIFDYAGYIFSSGKGALFGTSKRDIATEAGLNQDVNLFGKKRVKLGEGSLIAGLDKGLAGVKAGEKCYVIFSARYGFGPVQIGLVPKMSPLIYEVWVADVKKN
jgi:FKBP-type peptidyl-prolyl cis-trans isomerase